MRTNHFVRKMVITAVLCRAALAGTSICATVVDLGNQPLPDARVRVFSLLTNDRQFGASTDANGKACVESLPEDLYAVEVSMAGFLNVRYYPVQVKFPGRKDYSFRLPFGEIMEGGLGTDAVVSGTLEDNGEPACFVRLCLYRKDDTVPSACTDTNELGQYALSVPPGVYFLELSKLRRFIARSQMDLSISGWYRNKVKLPGTQ